MDALNQIKVYLVGGAVRDSLLNLPVYERDWVVVGATPELLLSKGYQKVGRDFPVFLHPVTHEEYALARTERKTGKGYTGFVCDFGPEITLEQDLMRRDLTINAIAMDKNQKLIDPYHGVDDLKRKILAHVSPAFREDPLRVLRVARFAARFHALGFKIADETSSLMSQMVALGEIDYLTVERVWKETEKALATQNPQVYFQTLLNCGALPRLFRHLCFNQIVSDAVKAVAALTDELVVRFATLCAHSQKRESIELLCHQLKVPNRFRDMALICQKFSQTVQNIADCDASQILNLLNQIDVWRQPHRLQQLILVSQAYGASHLNSSIYPQGKHLNQAYQIANSINPSHIIEKGITGKNIAIELAKLRKSALEDWI